jgi:MFS family permease
VINTFKKFGQEKINNEAFLTAVGAISAVFGGIRFVWSYLVDKYNFKLSYGIVLCINIIFGSTLVLVSEVKALYLIWVSMIVWAEGAHFALVPTLCAKLFGKHAPIVYGVAFSFGAISQILSSVMVRLYIKKVGYGVFYYSASGLSLISLLLLLFVFKEKKVC